MKVSMQKRVNGNYIEYETDGDSQQAIVGQLGWVGEVGPK